MEEGGRTKVKADVCWEESAALLPVRQLALRSVFSLFSGQEGQSQRTGLVFLQESYHPILLCLTRPLRYAERSAGRSKRLGSTACPPEHKEDSEVQTDTGCPGELLLEQSPSSSSTDRKPCSNSEVGAPDFWQWRSTLLLVWFHDILLAPLPVTQYSIYRHSKTYAEFKWILWCSLGYVLAWVWQNCN